jgi:hypothetical protein
LKDNISTKGIETTCASKILTGYKPIYDATVYELLQKEGVVMLGKANMDEFAMGSSCETSYYGGSKNPHSLDHVAGGSSGGVASAVGGNLAVYGRTKFDAVLVVCPHRLQSFLVAMQFLIMQRLITEQILYAFYGVHNIQGFNVALHYLRLEAISLFAAFTFVVKFPKILLFELDFHS